MAGTIGKSRAGAGMAGIFAAVGLAVVMAAAAVAGAGTVRVYGRDGSYRGRAETREDGTQRAYGRDGAYLGRSQPAGRQDGQGERFYGPNGQYKGRTDGGQGKGQAGQGVKP